MADYRSAGRAKAESVKDLVPTKWLLPSIPSIEEQIDVTGAYIRQYLSEKDTLITETDAVGIVAKTTTGLWSAVEVAEAFCHRAAIAHQLVNCLHEIFFDDALAEARRLDEHFAAHRKPIGPLHGLPVSLKDQFHVRGVETTMGYVGWIGTFEGQKGTSKEKIFESEMVRELRSLGAVLYCKTSVPNTLMCGETINNIIGYTPNPANRNLSSGGSSGGEGALIALRGSPGGFGTDIGGSIRIPAAFNGLFGLRPSAGRLPYEGMANSFDGQNSILSVVGPLATTADGLALLTRAILSTKPWLHDPLVVELPWRTDAADAVADPLQRTSNGLTFGYMSHDGHVSVHPPVLRAMQKVKSSLEQFGHQTIEWQPSVPHQRLVNVVETCWTFDGGADARKAHGLSGEVPSSRILHVDGPVATATDIMRTNVEKRRLQKEYMEYWNSTAKLTSSGRPIDAIICPVAPFAAACPDKYTYYGYTSFVNMLDYTSVVLPVLRADKAIDLRAEAYQPANDTDRATWESYDPEIYHGAHVSIQIVGRRFEEEKMLALAKYISTALQTAK